MTRTRLALPTLPVRRATSWEGLVLEVSRSRNWKDHASGVESLLSGSLKFFSSCRERGWGLTWSIQVAPCDLGGTDMLELNCEASLLAELQDLGIEMEVNFVGARGFPLPGEDGFVGVPGGIP